MLITPSRLEDFMGVSPENKSFGKEPMARGEVTMNEIMQVVYQWHWEAGFKAISRSLGFALRLAVQTDYQNRKLPHYNYPIEPIAWIGWEAGYDF